MAFLCALALGSAPAALAADTPDLAARLTSVEAAAKSALGGTELGAGEHECERQPQARQRPHPHAPICRHVRSIRSSIRTEVKAI